MTTLPALARFWVYALQGVMYELCFTALWNYSTSPDPRLMGESSIWSIWVYGMGGLVYELGLWRRGVRHRNILLRIMVSVAYTYLWEYCNGWVLRLFGACPWDYTERRWNVHGLITFEYAPAWIFAGLLHEKLMVILEGVEWGKGGTAGRNGVAKKVE